MADPTHATVGVDHVGLSGAKDFLTVKKTETGAGVPSFLIE